MGDCVAGVTDGVVRSRKGQSIGLMFAGREKEQISYMITPAAVDVKTNTSTLCFAGELHVAVH